MSMRPVTALFAILALVLPISDPGHAAGAGVDGPADPHCGLFAKVQQTLSANIGRKVDPLTRFDGIEVSCARRAIVFRQDVALTSGDIGQDWITRRTRHWSKTYCERKPAFAAAIRSGWTIATRLQLADGRTLTITAACHDADA